MRAIAASAAGHLLFLLLIVWRLGTPPVLVEPPVMNVELAPPPAPHGPAPRPRGERRTAVAALPPVVLHRPREEPTAQAEEPVRGLSPGVAVRPALRGLLGCAHSALLGLSAEERERCREQLGAAAVHEQAALAPRLELDRHGAFAQDPQPYLERRPKQGCKPRAAGEVSVMGEQGAAGGISCSWRF